MDQATAWFILGCVAFELNELFKIFNEDDDNFDPSDYFLGNFRSYYDDLGFADPSLN